MTDLNDQSRDPRRPSEGLADGLAGRRSERPAEKLALFERGTTAWVRAVADGEVPQPADLTPVEARGVAFERELRSRTARVFASAGASVPTDLRSRILAAVEQDRAGSGSSAGDHSHAESGDSGRQPLRLTDAPATARPVSPAMAGTNANQIAAPSTRDRSFWSSPKRWAPVAAAAVVLIVGGVYLSSGVFTGGFTGGFTGPGGLGGDRPVLTSAGFSPQMAEYITSKHQNACERTADLVKNFEFTRPETAVAEISTFLGKALCVKRMPGTMGCPAPIDYEGGQSARVPGTEKSLHLLMRLRGEGDAQATTASLFVMAKPTGIDLDPTVTYDLDPGEYHCEGYRVAVWVAEGLVYTLVTRDEADIARDTVLAAMYRPAPSARL